ncbi:MAG: hypothetical protein B7Y07_02445 [Halothiobacillus sp. 24-54-40]|jgi:DNA (cytosine-5)-methyltransferase 1|nr:MAG: hypothetical protein B7Y58_07825 [Halothiobacillus sp. 35-54-62]OYZ87841.1 MAG: hypothetical protein B7Y07_02445 [Halothiobacillus sp. 24-54-40]OZA79854.1 MAG: hypothetical protein B7X64_08310 [Halothiobacillus sp. 39-53-45]HQS01712.1 hypothetical protein [Halothiobacillus sp.]HQS28288.1 hypothetical protein [Halothiobacillus sp.]
MKNKISPLKQAEMLIKPLAMLHVPPKSDVEAVIDQWIHALATDSQFYSNPELAKPELLKTRVLTLLQENFLCNSRGFLGLDLDIKIKEYFYG